MKYALAALAGLSLHLTAQADPVHVGPHNFVRAETDRYMRDLMGDGEIGNVVHKRQPTDLDHQTVIRMNVDTMYSSGVYDMHEGPVTITLPEAPDGRYISAQVLNQDHLTAHVFHKGTNTFTPEDIGTRYAVVTLRVFMDATDEEDIAYANALQDLITVEQEGAGEFVVPEYDETSLNQTRMALLQLGALARGNFGVRMGTAEEVDPISHLIVTAVGWGLLPEAEAAYFAGRPAPTEEGLPHELILKDVPADAFWSVTMYNARGFMVENDLGINAINNVNATPREDGSYRLQFGECDAETVNCIPVPEGWNYILRAYRPGEEITSGEWTPPVMHPVE